jgi:hypothetical protein
MEFRDCTHDAELPSRVSRHFSARYCIKLGSSSGEEAFEARKKKPRIVQRAERIVQSAYSTQTSACWRKNKDSIHTATARSPHRPVFAGSGYEPMVTTEYVS